ncbi:hypothetical protein [Paenibacillus ehimensis]|uniref:Uncharacterized protein n=1 Tax=Paenibacillus ehimensis TaxID=79264 RepID=A0ABT8V9L6_9BACL|nr:hypothetical protein [Paenibacillus ehimensis]MDO3677001.1 hypothetical protein [Paenibacillus ehimensis]MEC0208806.1 hypothetical protein [Paenibacillus ehimensis]
MVQKLPENTLDNLIPDQALSCAATEQLIHFIKAKYNLLIGGEQAREKRHFTMCGVPPFLGIKIKADAG